MSKQDLESIVLEDDVQQFLETVSEITEGYDVYLGGGYLRDLYYNELQWGIHKDIYDMSGWDLFVEPLTPKDIDLFFVPKEGATEKTIPVLPKTYINYDKAASEIPDMQERGVARVRGMFVPALTTSDVQFIVYDKIMTHEELTGDMDVGICQVMYSLQDKTFYATEAFYDGHDNEEIEMLHTFDFVRMGKRLARMQDKFPDYSIVGDWDLSEFVNNVRENTGSFCE